MDLTPHGEDDARLQEIYARWLDFWTRVAFAVSLGALLLYLSAAVPALVAMEQLPELWTLPVARYVDLPARPRVGSWLGLIGSGDSLTFIVICLSAMVTLFCYLRIIPA